MTGSTKTIIQVLLQGLLCKSGVVLNWHMIFMLDVFYMASDRQLLFEDVRLLVKKVNHVVREEEVKWFQLKSFERTFTV